MARFKAPKKVIRLSDDGETVFVDGEVTGFPVADVKIMDAPENLGRVTLSTTASTTFSLDEGLATLTWPEKISDTSFSDLHDWVQVALRRIARSAGVNYPPKRE